MDSHRLPDSILVLGANGMLGSTVVRELRKCGVEVRGFARPDCDLLDLDEVRKSFGQIKPNLIINCAAVVGGIKANAENPVRFLSENLMIQSNVISVGSQCETVEKIISFGSSCYYPVNAANPITENAVMTGPLEMTNKWYAMSKLCGLYLSQAHSLEFEKQFLTLVPTNAYGPGDNFDLESSHVIPAMIRRLHEAKQKQLDEVVFWGSGSPLREFIFIDDLARAVIFLAKNWSSCEPVNVGTGLEISIKDLASKCSEIVGYTGAIKFDVTKPDGNPRKLLDSSTLRELGWYPKTSLSLGLSKTYDWYRNVNSKGIL